jgi:hypothetical protein
MNGLRRDMEILSGTAVAGLVTVWPVFDCTGTLDDVSVHVTVPVGVPASRRPSLDVGLNHDGGLGFEQELSNHTWRTLITRHLRRGDHFDGHAAPSE